MIIIIRLNALVTGKSDYKHNNMMIDHIFSLHTFDTQLAQLLSHYTYICTPIVTNNNQLLLLLIVF